MPARVSGADLSPKMLLRNVAAPSGPIPASKSAEGAAEELHRGGCVIVDEHGGDREALFGHQSCSSRGSAAVECLEGPGVR